MAYGQGTISRGRNLREQELKRAQKGDAAIGPTIQAIKDGKWPEEEHASPGLSQLKREMGKFTMK